MKITKLFNLVLLFIIFGLIFNACKTINTDNSESSPSQLKAIFDREYSVHVKAVSDNQIGFFACVAHITDDDYCVSAFKTIDGQDVVFSYEKLAQDDALFEEFSSKSEIFSPKSQASRIKLANAGFSSSALLLNFPTSKQASSAGLEKITREKIQAELGFITNQQQKLSQLQFTYSSAIDHSNNTIKSNMFDYAKNLRKLVLEDMKVILEKPNININHVEMVKQLDIASSQLLSKSTATEAPDLVGFHKLIYKMNESVASIPLDVRSSYYYDVSPWGFKYRDIFTDYNKKQLTELDKNISAMKNYISNLDDSRKAFKQASLETLEFVDKSLKTGFNDQITLYNHVFSRKKYTTEIRTSSVKFWLDDMTLSHHLLPWMQSNDQALSEIKLQQLNNLHANYKKSPSAFEFKGSVKAIRELSAGIPNPFYNTVSSPTSKPTASPKPLSPQPSQSPSTTAQTSPSRQAVPSTPTQPTQTSPSRQAAPGTPTQPTQTSPTRQVAPSTPTQPTQPTQTPKSTRTSPIINQPRQVVSESLQIINEDIVMTEKGVNSASKFPGTPMPPPNQASQLTDNAVLFSENSKHLIQDASPKHLSNFPTPRVYPSRLSAQAGELAMEDGVIRSSRGVAKAIASKNGKLRALASLLLLPVAGVVAIKSMGVGSTPTEASQSNNLATDQQSQAGSLLKIAMFQAIFTTDPSNNLEVKSVPDTLYALGAFLRSNSRIFPSHQTTLYSYCLPSNESNQQASCYAID